MCGVIYNFNYVIIIVLPITVFNEGISTVQQVL